MVLVENKVNDRRDRQIQEAIDVRNWKQALSLCEKRLKRGEKSDNLSVCPYNYKTSGVQLLEG